MKLLHRSLAAGALLLFAAACSTDSPMGVDSGVEILPVTAMDSHLLGVTLCKSWLPVGEEPPQEEFDFTVEVEGGEPFDITIDINEDQDVGGSGCVLLGSWPAETNLTITENMDAGIGIGQIWLVERGGAGSDEGLTKFCAPDFVDVDCDTDDLAEAVVTINVGEVEQVFFKNVAVEFVPLEISKTAAGSYDRTVTWELTKTVDPDSHSGAPGDSFESEWTVTATKSESSGNYQVTGVITVTNPNPFDVAFSLSDVLDDGTAAVISCPDTDDNTGTAPANGSIDCDYTASPDDASAEENTATVTSDLGEESTTEGFTWTENLIGDDEVTLSDERFSYSELISSTTVEIFPETFTCPADPREYTDGLYTETYTNTANLDGPNTDLEASAEVTITCELPPGGGEGCTPGFWRQAHHYPYWTAPYTPTTLFGDVFDDAFPGMTLGEVVQINGGGLNALGRHTVAALLNAASPEVNYGYATPQAVIDAFNAVYPDGDFEGLKDLFEGFNEEGCSVDKSGDTGNGGNNGNNGRGNSGR